MFCVVQKVSKPINTVLLRCNLEKEEKQCLLQSLPLLRALPVDASFDSPAPVFSPLEFHATEKMKKTFDHNLYYFFVVTISMSLNAS